MELPTAQPGQVGLDMSSPRRIPAGFMEDVGWSGRWTTTFPQLLSFFFFLTSADQDSHARLPDVGDYSHERL